MGDARAENHLGRDARFRRGLLIYCADYKCSHHRKLSADRWPDEVRLSDIEPRFVCQACGRRGADVRPDFNWNVTGPVGGMCYR
jgi:hypothetical protein